MRSQRVIVITIFLALGMMIAACGDAVAVEPSEILTDPKLEARARNLSAELRCLVCQNQSIDDSDAPLAKDLRVLVRERLKSGDTDEEVIQFVVSRYGEFVLLRPPVGFHTALLWGMPIIVLILASLAVLFIYRNRSLVSSRGTESLTDEEKMRLKQILED